MIQATALYTRAASQSVALRALLDDLLASRPIEADAAPSCTLPGRGCAPPSAATCDVGKPAFYQVG